MGLERPYKNIESRGLKIGCLNIRGCNRIGVMEEVGSIFEGKRLDILALSETRLNWTGGLWFGNVWGRSSGCDIGENMREGVALLLKKDLWYLVEGWKMVSSRIMWVKLKIITERWVFVCAHAPDLEEFDYSVNKRFWNSLHLCLKEFHPNDKIVLMGDLNARVGNQIIERIVLGYGMPGKDYNGEKLIELCRLKNLAIGNTYFRKRSNNKYTWKSYYTDMSGNHIMALIDYICVSQCVVSSLFDVHVMRDGARGISDHYLVVGKLMVLLHHRKLQQKKERIRQRLKHEIEINELKIKHEKEMKQLKIKQEKEMKECKLKLEKDMKEIKNKESHEKN